MQFSIVHSSAHQTQADCVVVAIFSKQKLSPAAAALDKACGKIISQALKLGDIQGECGQALLVYPTAAKCGRILLVGMGAAEKLSLQQYQKNVAHAAQTLQQGGTGKVVSFLHQVAIQGFNQEQIIRAEVIAAGGALYRFAAHKPSSKAPSVPISRWDIGTENAKISASICEEAAAVVLGMNLARDLGNQPSNVATPKYLEKQALQLAKRYPAIKVEVISQEELKKMGAGAFYSVAKGSANKGRMIIMQYQNAGKKTRPTVLVGKGITFDTGGISLKPGPGMDEMKFDMCGAASVFGTMLAVAQQKAKVNVVGIIAAAENMPSSNASKPGDIVSTLSGKTVEILNTDAEGRLVLCDALTYAQKFEPKTVIDIATLTGACVIALGKHASGLMSNNDQMADTLCALGQQTGDRVWRLPIWQDYQSQLASNFADMQNIGGREAGSITAACFLARFAENYTWAHLDIAGTAWLSDANKGATGRPVPLLVSYVLSQK